jgi:hypothetical protein
MLETILGFRLPPEGAYRHGEFYERIRSAVPVFGPSSDMQEIYKSMIALEYTMQYTDDMHTGISSYTAPATEVHHPFYDWEFIQTTNRVSYAMGMRPIYTFRTWNKMPAVRKRVLRLTVQDAVPKQILYRAKKTCPSLHLLCNGQVKEVIDIILRRWGSSLVESLDPEAGQIAQGYIDSYRARTEFHLNQDEELLWGIFVVCYLATLNQSCLSRSFDLQEELTLSHASASSHR